MELQFMGHPASYWVELQNRADELNVSHLIQELADAYAKIGFYERRISEMHELTK